MQRKQHSSLPLIVIMFVLALGACNGSGDSNGGDPPLGGDPTPPSITISNAERLVSEVLFDSMNFLNPVTSDLEEIFSGKENVVCDQGSFLDTSTDIPPEGVSVGDSIGLVFNNCIHQDGEESVRRDGGFVIEVLEYDAEQSQARVTGNRWFSVEFSDGEENDLRDFVGETFVDRVNGTFSFTCSGTIINSPIDIQLSFETIDPLGGDVLDEAWKQLELASTGSLIIEAASNSSIEVIIHSATAVELHVYDGDDIEVDGSPIQTTLEALADLDD